MEICVTVFSPDDIGDAVVYVQVDVNETISPPLSGQTLASKMFDLFWMITSVNRAVICGKGGGL